MAPEKVISAVQMQTAPGTTAVTGGTQPMPT